METFDNLEQKNGTLEVTENSKKYLKTAATWSKFMAVLKFIAIGFLILTALVLLAGGSAMESYAGKPIPSFALGLCYLAFATVSFFPARYLYLFSQKAADAIVANDTFEMEAAFKKLKSYWKFTGIMTIVILILCITVVPVIVIVAATSGVLGF
jgi:hypothetical protein